VDGRRLAEEEAQQRRHADGVRQDRAAAMRRRLALGALGVAAAAIVALIATRSTPVPAVPLPRIVAVLPFQNGDSDATFDFLRMALAGETATTLSRAQGIAVRPFSTTATSDLAHVSVQQAGAATHANTLVTGGFRTVQEQRQVTLEAIDVDSNTLLWRAAIEAPAQSMIATHVQVALAIRGGLVPALGSSLVDAMPEPRSDEAYELYLRSSVLPYDPGSNPQATAMLQRATDLDPEYAPAWLSLARRYYRGAGRGCTIVRPTF